jgi:rhodanese-related sulfurtransferase
MNLKAIPKMISVAAAVVRTPTPKDIEKVKDMTRDAFPAVRQLATRILAEWLGSNQRVLLVDVRAPEEFAVSHLKGAVNLQKAAEILRVISETKPARTVLYCSVGYRSSEVANRLRKRGPGEIYNLEGSLFEWANEGRPVYRGEEQVQHVHPYKKKCVGMLKPGLAWLENL